MIRPGTTRNLGRILPGREAVTLRVRTAEGTFTEHSLTAVKLWDSIYSTMDPMLATRTARWLINRAQLDRLGLTALKINDEIQQTDTAGTRWTIEGISRDMFGNDWNCDTRKTV